MRLSGSKVLLLAGALVFILSGAGQSVVRSVAIQQRHLSAHAAFLSAGVQAAIDNCSLVDPNPGIIITNCTVAIENGVWFLKTGSFASTRDGRMFENPTKLKAVKLRNIDYPRDAGIEVAMAGSHEKCYVTDGKGCCELYCPPKSQTPNQTRLP